MNTLTISTREARSHFSDYLGKAEDGDGVIISRRGHKNVALVAADTLRSLTDFKVNIKAKLLDIILDSSPDEVNKMHELICELMNASEIKNADVIASIEEAEAGDLENWEMP